MQNRNRIKSTRTRNFYRNCKVSWKSYVCRLRDRGRKVKVLRIWIVQLHNLHFSLLTILLFRKYQYQHELPKSWRHHLLHHQWIELSFEDASFWSCELCQLFILERRGKRARHQHYQNIQEKLLFIFQCTLIK